MKRLVSWKLAVLVLAAASALGTTGCAWLNRFQTTQITVQFSGEELLHMAIVPRELPDGSRPEEQVAALLKEVAERAGGYTYIEQVAGGWVPPGEKQVIKELNDLLLVKGPPEVGPFLRVRLRKDFDQEYPFVVSLPTQSIAVVRPVAAPQGEPAEAAAAQ
ncbi:MAG: hypothetical protein ACYS8L_07410 [Planctomycetota bacterium]|jgi:hypothetical protein